MAGALDPEDGGQQLLLGKMLLERGLITPDQLREALVERARSLSDGDNQATPLGGILVKKGYLTDSQLLGLIAEQGTPSPAVAPSNSPSNSPSSAPPISSHPILPAVSVPDPMNDGGRLGKYQLTRELGRGGMGAVYEALDGQLNRRVALKLMLANPNADPKERALEEERFIQEAQLSAKLKHPNIVTVYEAGLLEGRQFLAMELIEGLPFNDWRKTVTIREQVQVLRDVCQAVHHAHEQGILHRDLKPRNILVTPGGHSYVTDFGLAKSLGKNVHASLTGSGAVVGTPAYMSPEQAQGLDRVDWRTDIYSLGVILYECMTGHTPFTGESPIEILMKVVKDPVVPPLQAVDSASALGLDKGIENICLKALAKKDRDRYVTAQAFADDLTKWLSGETVKVSAPKPPRKPLKIRRVYVLTVALFLALIGGLLYLAKDMLRPSVHDELIAAKRFLDEENYAEALIQYRLANAKDSRNEEALAGIKEAQEGLARKQREAEERMRASVIEKFKEAEAKQVKAAEFERAEAEAPSEEERQKIIEQRLVAEAEAKKAMKEAADAEAQLRRTQGLVINPAGTGEDVWKGAINLLSIIDPRRNSVWGTWDFEDLKLVSERTPYSRLEIPFQLPQEYDLRMLFERRSGSGPVSVILSRGGRQFRWEMGGETNTRFAFECLRQFKTLEFPKVRKEAICLQNHRLYTLLVQVRADGVKALLDGRPVLEWATDFTDVSLNPSWLLRNTLRLGLGSHECELAAHRLELLEVTGRGRKSEPAPLPMMKALGTVPGSLKPGLVGEYFQGASFQALATRRIDPLIDFRWKEGPAWAGGPVDAFSARWSGYLHVPRTAKYQFTATADDGVRLFIDELQIIAGWNSRRDAPRSAECVLEEGYHRLRLEYFETAYLASVTLAWSSVPGQSPAPVPAKSFFYSSADYVPLAPVPVTESLGALSARSNNITAVAFDPAGKILAVAGEDRKVRFYDPTNRKDLGSPASHLSGVLCVAFAPDGKTFATGARDGRVRIWDAQNRNELRTLEGPTGVVQAVAFSPDGKRLAAGSYDRSVRIWELEGEEDPKVLMGHGRGIEALAFSPNGKHLATAGLEGTIRLWETATGKEEHVLEGHGDFVEAIAFSPSGKMLASAGGDGLVKLWDVDSGRDLRTLGGRGDEMMSLAFSPDGALLAAGGNDGMIRIWDAAQGREIRLLPAHTARVSSLAFLPKGRLLASGSFDATARLWNLEK